MPTPADTLPGGVQRALADLPVGHVAAEFAEALRVGRGAVVVAPPGSGKTTTLPLVAASVLRYGDAPAAVVVSQPRRVAARATAARMAELWGDPIGRTIGYRVRGERRVSSSTRIEVMTEGLLVRRLQADPTLEGIDAVVLDELHERSISLDLALALLADVRASLRPDLVVVVLSATLDPGPVARLLGDVPVISASGRPFPIDITYRDPEAGARTARTPNRPGSLSDGAIDAVSNALPSVLQEAPDRGDVLAFLPGEREIRRTEQRLAGRLSGIDVLPLYGALRHTEQDRVLRPNSDARNRRIVLTTSIAESSLTIPGIRAVIDAGLSRRPRFDPTRGLGTLETVRVSQASADQRAGRAARLGPGIAVRLWAEHRRLEAFDTAEILSGDLAPLLLEILAWGAQPDDLAWLDQPPSGALAAAAELLELLGAAERRAGGHRITGHGRALVDQGTHPRLAHLLVRGGELGCGRQAATVAALLSEGDILTGPPNHRFADLDARIAVLDGDRAPSGMSVRRGALAAARQQMKRWQPQVADDGNLSTGGLVALAYPDRIAVRRRPESGAADVLSDFGERDVAFVMASGRGAILPAADPLAQADFLAVAEATDPPSSTRRVSTDSRIRVGASLDLAELAIVAGNAITTTHEVRWDPRAGTRGDVAANRVVRVGVAELRRTRLDEPTAEEVVEALTVGVRTVGLELLGNVAAARSLQQRTAFAVVAAPDGAQDWPSIDDESLLAELDEWLAPHLIVARRAHDLSAIDLESVLRFRLGHDTCRALDRIAPREFVAPTGSRRPIRYTAEGHATTDVRVQEVFGMTSTPTVADGNVALTLELLSPAQRPIATTSDLSAFWTNAWRDVRSEMRGRYPKHYWPEDPQSATPTTRTKAADDRAARTKRRGS